MSDPSDEQALRPLHALLGAWSLELRHPAFTDTVVAGEASFEWLEGERFLLQRSTNEHPDFPDSLSVIGVTDGEQSMHYFDSRGVFRIYLWSFDDDGRWRISRDDPGFSQRFRGSFEDGDNTLAGRWQLSRDNDTWDDDLEITYRRTA